jgi:hypothetical protein
MARDVRVTSLGAYRCEMETGPHRVALDGPPEIGGRDAGPSPAEMLMGAIGA